MKVKVVITKEQEMEIENSASLAVLHKLVESTSGNRLERLSKRVG